MRHLILILSLCTLVYAEPDFLQIIKNDPIKRAAVLQGLGLTPDSRFADAAFGGVPPKTPIGEQIIDHRVVDQGRELPDPESIRHRYSMSAQDAEKMREFDLANARRNESLPPYKTPPLPDCQKSETQVFGTLVKETKEVTMDILFISEKDAERAKALGKGVNVRVYQANSSDGASVAALTIGTICLPTRYRATFDYAQLITGDDVFKIY